jgi:hypothetical protein
LKGGKELDNREQEKQKSKYSAPSCEIRKFSTEDIITTSGAFDRWFAEWDTI